MNISKIAVKNFRLLKDVELSLEDNTTVIVGRNNSGKTSLTELFRQLLSEKYLTFKLEDFSLSVHDKFWEAFLLKNSGAEENIIRAVLPTIEVTLSIVYDKGTPELGILSDFIIDLDPDSNEVKALIEYKLKEGKISELFEDIVFQPDAEETAKKSTFFKLLRERVLRLFATYLTAIDPTDSTNIKPLEIGKLRTLLQAGFINAQRGLDDETNKEKDILGKILERILNTAQSEMASSEDQTNAKALEEAVKEIQEKIDSDFNEQLNKLIPALSIFGYPGLSDPQLSTETILDVQRLLENNTKIRYSKNDGVSLPETYNGLGSRNLIYILFQIFEFFKSYKAKIIAPGLHLIFIEEPEAHMHPQMMEVFIRKLQDIVNKFVMDYNENQPWPVQFIVTTHSTHIANEADFESIRYFLCTKDNGNYTRVKDLRNGIGGHSFDEDREFLHKYLTLTRCDLFFADKSILIEGPTERILMPEMIKKVDALIQNENNLSSQYISVIEVGGAYTHHFFKLLEFLELRTLIITDLDSVRSEISQNGKMANHKCKVADGSLTSNASIKKWFDDSNISPITLISKPENEKIKNILRIAYQIPENGSSICGRSFEDAFMLANIPLCNVEGTTDEEKAEDAWKKAQSVDKKTDFALKYAISKKEWIVPEYIKEGLLWLAENLPEEEIEQNIAGAGDEAAAEGEA